VVASSKHMGSLMNINGAITDEIYNRLGKGKQAVGRVGTKFLFKLITPVGIRVEIYKTLVLTVLLYNLHVRVVAGWQMRLFERFQTRVLRGIDGKGRHITKETNQSLRRRMGVPSIESLLRVRRILFWQSMLRGGDATRGVRMVAFSPTQFDESPLTSNRQMSLLMLLKADLVLLREANPGLDLGINDAPYLSGDDLFTLEGITAVAVLHLIQYNAPAEDDADARFGKRQRQQIRASSLDVQWSHCPKCQRQTISSRLAQHMWAAHNMRHNDSIAIVCLKCPKCSKNFKSRYGVMQHYRHCKLRASTCVTVEASSSSNQAPQSLGTGVRLRQAQLFSQAAPSGADVAQGDAAEGIRSWTTVARRGRRSSGQ
jgi:hypothetical protein